MAAGASSSSPWARSVARASLTPAGRRAQARAREQPRGRASAAPARALGGPARGTRAAARRRPRAPSCSATTRSACDRQRSRRCSASSDRRAPLLVEAPQQPDELVAGDRVELRGRLVEQHEPRAAGERGAERDALQLAAGELVRRAVEQRLDAQRQRRPPPPRARRRPAPSPRFSSGKASSCAHRAEHDLRLRVLEERAGDRARSRRARARACRGRRPARGRRTSPPWKCGTRPPAARSSVDLPQADSPASTTNSPGSIASDTSRSAGARRSG